MIQNLIKGKTSEDALNSIKRIKNEIDELKENLKLVEKLYLESFDLPSAGERITIKTRHDTVTVFVRSAFIKHNYSGDIYPELTFWKVKKDGTQSSVREHVYTYEIII